MRQARAAADGRAAQGDRGLHQLLEDVVQGGLQPAVGEAGDIEASECAKMLRGFFERDILGEDGQDVLRYNPALETAAKKEFGNVDLVEVFQKQRCLPLVECLPSNFSRSGSMWIV